MALCSRDRQTEEAPQLHASLAQGGPGAYAGFVECLEDKELPEEEKDKDRTAVLEIPASLRVAGYTIVEARSEAGRARAAAQK